VRESDETLRCPSAQPGMPDAQILGVVRANTPDPRIAYLNEPVTASADILAAAAPALPGEIFRLAARCEQAKCTHFESGQCRLATRIVQMLPAVTEDLPPCLIRKSCRWFKQEGRAACVRCPQIVTANRQIDELTKRVAGAAQTEPRAQRP